MRPIPLATLPCPVRMTNSPMSASRHGLERHLFQRERLQDIARFHEQQEASRKAAELEAWCDGWRLAA